MNEEVGLGRRRDEKNSIEEEGILGEVGKDLKRKRDW
jgi:hypothetical protein